MKIRTVYTQNGISFYAVNANGSAKIGDHPLNALSVGKNEKVKIIRKLYEDGREYDPIAFMNSFIALRNLKVARFVTQSMIDKWVEELKKMLKVDDGE